MPKSKNRNKKGSHRRGGSRFGQSKIYRKPVAKKTGGQVKACSTNFVEINYAELLKKQLTNADYSVHKVNQIQNLALNHALLEFNKEPLVVPCEAGFEYFGPKKKPKLIYHTRYQDVKKCIMDKMREFNLYFGFSSINSQIDERSGLKEIQVEMNLCHGLGGKTTVKSKPVLVVSCNIDGDQLTIDKCVSVATTKAKKDVLIGSLLNVRVDMAECYSGTLKEYTDDQWNPITPLQVNKLNKVFRKLPNHLVFLKHLKDNYNVRNIREVRGFQFDDVLFDLESWEPIARAS